MVGISNSGMAFCLVWQNWRGIESSHPISPTNYLQYINKIKKKSKLRELVYCTALKETFAREAIARVLIPFPCLAMHPQKMVMDARSPFLHCLFTIHSLTPSLVIPSFVQPFLMACCFFVTLWFSSGMLDYVVGFIIS